MSLFFEENKRGGNLPLFLIGNKNDLERKVPKKDIDDFLNNNSDFTYKSVSAKTDDVNINSLFQELEEEIYENNKDSHKKGQKNIVLKFDYKTKKNNCIFRRCLV